ncbi:Uma2 family endonuclease [Anthocerotibacter panamensis]|uniref:Uma2 family endonuclease n=1 Tax=Anthocerotibacter panamensis TaxID=2857077 RepID=UPI001C4080E3
MAVLASTVVHLHARTVTYPSTDGEPVAKTYVHLYAMLITLEVLRQYLQGRQATVLANQFLYYAEGFPKLRVAPDVMVIFDVTPGGRDNYKLWEERQVPAVIFEITSKATQEKDKGFNKELYAQLGIKEYWLFDPKGEWIVEQLRGYRLIPITLEGEEVEVYMLIQDSRCQPLGLHLEVQGERISFYREDTGEKLPIPDELQVQLNQARQAQEQAEQRAERLAQRLRALGIDPEEA